MIMLDNKGGSGGSQSGSDSGSSESSETAPITEENDDDLPF